MIQLVTLVCLFFFANQFSIAHTLRLRSRYSLVIVVAEILKINNNRYRTWLYTLNLLFFLHCILHFGWFSAKFAEIVNNWSNLNISPHTHTPTHRQTNGRAPQHKQTIIGIIDASHINGLTEVFFSWIFLYFSLIFTMLLLMNQSKMERKHK